MGRLDGRVALFTGAGSTLARGVVGRFVAEGAQVGLLERDAERLDALLGELPAGSACGIVGDVTRRADHDAAVAATVEAFGHLSCVVTMAAVADRVPALSQYPADRLEQAFDEVLAVNVKGGALAALAALPWLRRERGNVIVTLSTAGLMPGATGALYTIAKHAAVGLVRQLAYELAPEVRVNGVVPGGIVGAKVTTAPSTAGLGTVPAPDGDDAFARTTPLERFGTPDQYAGLYVTLADDHDSAMVTGSIVVADGGVSLVGHGRGTLDAIQAHRRSPPHD